MLLCALSIQTALAQSTEVTIEVPYEAGWNLLSVPVGGDPLRLASEAFPGAIAVFEFSNGTFKPVTEVSSGPGYWVLFPSSGTLAFTGPSLNELLLALQQGWNLIGGLSASVAVTDLEQDPLGLVEQVLDADRSPAAALEPGAGYWVLAVQDGSLHVVQGPGTEETLVQFGPSVTPAIREHLTEVHSLVDQATVAGGMRLDVPVNSFALAINEDGAPLLGALANGDGALTLDARSTALLVTGMLVRPPFVAEEEVPELMGEIEQHSAFPALVSKIQSLAEENLSYLDSEDVLDLTNTILQDAIPNPSESTTAVARSIQTDVALARAVPISQKVFPNLTKVVVYDGAAPSDYEIVNKYAIFWWLEAVNVATGQPLKGGELLPAERLNDVTNLLDPGKVTLSANDGLIRLKISQNDKTRTRHIGQLATDAVEVVSTVVGLQEFTALVTKQVVDPAFWQTVVNDPPEQVLDAVAQKVYGLLDDLRDIAIKEFGKSGKAAKAIAGQLLWGIKLYQTQKFFLKAGPMWFSWYKHYDSSDQVEVCKKEGQMVDECVGTVTLLEVPRPIALTRVSGSSVSVEVVASALTFKPSATINALRLLLIAPNGFEHGCDTRVPAGNTAVSSASCFINLPSTAPAGVYEIGALLSTTEGEERFDIGTVAVEDLTVNATASANPNPVLPNNDDVNVTISTEVTSNAGLDRVLALISGPEGWRGSCWIPVTRGEKTIEGECPITVGVHAPRGTYQIDIMVWMSNSTTSGPTGDASASAGTFTVGALGPPTGATIQISSTERDGFWTVPATVQLSDIRTTSPFGPVAGGGFLDEARRAGAAIYFVHEVQGFPTRANISGYPLRGAPVGFIAIQNAGDPENERLWIAAASLFRENYGGGYTADREYQIRYYKDKDGETMEIGLVLGTFAGMAVTGYDVDIQY